MVEPRWAWDGPPSPRTIGPAGRDGFVQLRAISAAQPERHPGDQRASLQSSGIVFAGSSGENVLAASARIGPTTEPPGREFQVVSIHRTESPGTLSERVAPGG